MPVFVCACASMHVHAPQGLHAPERACKCIPLCTSDIRPTCAHGYAPADAAGGRREAARSPGDCGGRVSAPPGALLVVCANVWVHAAMLCLKQMVSDCFQVAPDYTLCTTFSLFCQVSQLGRARLHVVKRSGRAVLLLTLVMSSLHSVLQQCRNPHPHTRTRDRMACALRSALSHRLVPPA